MKNTNYERIDMLTWLFTGDWLSHNGAYHFADYLLEMYTTSNVFVERDVDDIYKNNGWLVYIEFKDESDEAEFILKESS